MAGLPSFVRTTAERLSRGRAFQRTLRVGDRAARIYVSGDAQLKYLKLGSAPFDQDLIDISLGCLLPDDIVWDIGANIGVFSVAAAMRAKSVTAFEADIWLAGLIRQTARIKQNANLDINVVPAALSNQSGISVFQIARRGRASNALKAAGGRSQMGGVRDEVMVPTLNLDTVCDELDAPDFVKIDVEGAEMMVVSGGSNLFREKRPLTYVEVGPEAFEAVTGFFNDHGYAALNQRAELLEEGAEQTPNLFFAHESHAPRLAKFRAVLSEEGVS